MYDLRVLGCFRVTDAEGTEIALRGHQRQALALLLIRPRERWTTGALCGILWGDQPPENPENAVQQVISGLRATLRRHGIEHLIVTVPGGYRADPADGTLDLDRFRALRKRAAKELEAGACEAAERLLSAALSCWPAPCGPCAAFPDLPDALDVQGVVASLQEEFRLAEERLIGLRLMLGRHLDALPMLQAWSGSDPTNEVACELLMKALRAAGRRIEALSAFDRTRKALRGIGIDPCLPLHDLFTATLRDTAGPAGQW
jgi:DNA-binding SARP family transcriptional activator